MKPKTRNFTLRLDELLARKLDYIGAYYGRTARMKLSGRCGSM